MLHIRKEEMEIIISKNKQELGKEAAKLGAQLIQKAIQEKGEANIIVATGASQFEMLAHLVNEKVDWHNVTTFHLDEYIGIQDTHPASFRKYLKERFAHIVPLKKFNYVNGEVDPLEECNRLGELIREATIDVAFIGIGENSHIAFNDPPADFETEEPYIVVHLDKDCRMQQLGEGWFSTLDDVPVQAISMSVHQIMKSEAIICSVPDGRKALAVKKTIESPVDPSVPSSILKEHKAVWLFADNYSAALLS